ncbi:disulfide bond formation protein B [Streptomyces sp. NBC_01304]|uniref:disulfide bond formation protein B n=1 Tax=Streptomyces sp. NBC_01304 TaxID=2903818 RepID=UPI002E0E13D8|nr:disulfide bond formation protein B [Streptomyces sp. NBC_01304]
MITMTTTTLNPEAPASAGLSNKLGLIFANLYVLGMCGTIGGAYVFQFALWEYPCPMCLLQRMFLLISALGPAYIVHRSRKGAVTTKEFATGWGMAIVAALLGSTASITQVLMHIVPPDAGYAGALFGLHLYTWAAITFGVAVLAAGVNLVLTQEAQPLDAAADSPVLRGLGAVTLAVLVFFAVSNLVACFFLQGLHWQMPGDPTSYAFFADLF